MTIRRIVGSATVPVLVDAGVGCGGGDGVRCDGVLTHTAVAEAKDVIMMVHAMRAAVEPAASPTTAGG